MNLIYECVQETQKTGKTTSFYTEGNGKGINVDVDLIDGEIYFTYKIRVHCNDVAFEAIRDAEQFIFDRAFYPDFDEPSVDVDFGPNYGEFVINKPLPAEYIDILAKDNDIILEDDEKVIFKPKVKDGR